MDPIVINKAANYTRLVREIAAVPGVTVEDTANPLAPNAWRMLVSVLINDAAQEISLFPDDMTPQAVMDAVVAAVNAHDPTPDPPPLTNFADETIVRGQVRTTDATAKEIYRYTLRVQTGYFVEAKLIGVDAGNGAVRARVARAVFKRLNAAAIQVGALQADTPMNDTAASAWAENMATSGNDFIVTVTGAASRNIDWSLTLKVTRFGPGGLA